MDEVTGRWLMHDWTFQSISVDWKAGTATFSLTWSGNSVALVAHGVRDLHIPRRFDWGPSVSVNKSHGPSPIEDGLLRFSMEMQSGDTIEVVAAKFDLPPPPT
jgi:hypothetical protein